MRCSWVRKILIELRVLHRNSQRSQTPLLSLKHHFCLLFHILAPVNPFQPPPFPWTLLFLPNHFPLPRGQSKSGAPTSHSSWLPPFPFFFTGSTGKFGTAKNCPCAGHCRDWIAGKIFSWKRQDAQGITSLMKFNSWHFVISIFCRILQLPEQKALRPPQKSLVFLD